MTHERLRRKVASALRGVRHGEDAQTRIETPRRS